VAFLSSILIEAGYRVGMYTSPGLHRFNDRIRVNNHDIADESLAEITGVVKEKIDWMISENMESPTEFEIVTAIAFLYYLDMNCDIVVLEVGLGGRLDSTNIIPAPLVSIITTIDYDHMDILGNTLAEIAHEKAGILKRGTELVLYPQQSEADKVIIKTAEELEINVHKVSFENIEILAHDEYKQSFKKEGEVYTIGILGEHQIKNAATAMEAVKVLRRKGFIIDDNQLKNGLSTARWPGRFEILSHKPLYVADGAHNLQGVEVLAENLRKYFAGKRIIFIMGVLRDKKYEEMVNKVLPLADFFIAVTPDNTRALKAEELKEVIVKSGGKCIVADSVSEAIKLALDKAGDDKVICSFGSLYYISEVREAFLNH
jgi:dihydrofolate synthase/folylpolyglutamate synthase